MKPVTVPSAVKVTTWPNSSSKPDSENSNEHVVDVARVFVAFPLVVGGSVNSASTAPLLSVTTPWNSPNAVGTRMDVLPRSCAGVNAPLPATVVV